jgi:hypothetical protein
MNEGDIVNIPGAPGGERRVLLAARYDYQAQRTKCPACGGLGVPWKGWFTCDDCLAVALVSDGRCFALLASTSWPEDRSPNQTGPEKP